MIRGAAKSSRQESSVGPQTQWDINHMDIETLISCHEPKITNQMVILLRSFYLNILGSLELTNVCGIVK